MRLADNACIPCKGGVLPLSHSEFEPLLQELDGWNIADEIQLCRSFAFSNFVDAMNFANAITPIAEDQGHHPDLFVRWGEVKVILWTHSINGLTLSDFYMADKIERVFESLPADRKK